MKVKVNRRLNAGLYRINFEVSDFTPEEVAKMASFGIPQIKVSFSAGTGLVPTEVALNALNNRIEAAFPTEEQAKKYEEGVLGQIQAAMKRLRDSQDGFSGSQEVQL